jgi:nucleoside-diphosphate-sugar epimerase
MAENAPKLFCFGLGYCAQALGRALLRAGWRVGGTCQGEDMLETLLDEGFEAYLSDSRRPLAEARARLRNTTHLLSSVPPTPVGDPVLAYHRHPIQKAAGIEWVGYLSSVGVYGDWDGKPVNEETPPAPSHARARRRLAAEADWRELWRRNRVPVHVFRLAGIYGHGRSTLDQVKAGRARRIDRPDQKFSRIHVDDVVAVLRASMARPNPGAVYNLADDEPACQADVVAHACKLLGVEAPPLIPFAQAEKSMSAMARSFWHDRRLVENDRIKTELGVQLAHPTYREGLKTILEESGLVD